MPMYWVLLQAILEVFSSGFITVWEPVLYVWIVCFSNQQHVEEKFSAGKS